MRRRARRGDAGAALVETALVLPVLLVFLLGVAELAVGFLQDRILTDGIRSTGRIESSASPAMETDFIALSTLQAGLSGIDGASVEYVVIYRVTGTNSEPPSACVSRTGIANGGDPAKFCNTYTAADLEAVSQPSATPESTGFGSCTGRHRNWCPTVRDDDPGDGVTDRIGIAVRLEASTVTGLLGESRTLDDLAVFVVQPDFEVSP